MNSFLYGDTVTLYNRYRNGRDDEWQRTVLRGVQCREKVDKNVDSTGIHHSPNLSLTIPADVDAGERVYLHPRLFSERSNRESYFTLDPSHNLDVIVIGECNEELSDDYTLDELMHDHGYTTIKAVADNTVRPQGKHWKVMAV